MDLTSGSYAILLFTASDLASITSHIHNWVLFLLWLRLFILSGVISPLISSSILGTYQPGEFIFQCPIFLPFHTVHGVLAEKAMAPHSSSLAWKIPWMEEPGGLQSMGSLRVRHDWATSLSLFTLMHWRRKWQPTPVFLPWESQGQGSLVGCRLWGHTELDTTEAT